jgi:hypothetical protein
MQGNGFGAAWISDHVMLVRGDKASHIPLAHPFALDPAEQVQRLFDSIDRVF